MNLSDNQRMKLDELEIKVAKYFNIRVQDIINFTNNHNISLARSYVFYIAHHDMKISASCIAKEYYRKVRGVFKSISKIKYLIENQRRYRNIYNDIVQ